MSPSDSGWGDGTWGCALRVRVRREMLWNQTRESSNSGMTVFELPDCSTKRSEPPPSVRSQSINLRDRKYGENESTPPFGVAEARLVVRDSGMASQYWWRCNCGSGLLPQV